MVGIPVGLRPPSIPSILVSPYSPLSQQLQGPQIGVILIFKSKNRNFQVGPSESVKWVHFIPVVASDKDMQCRKRDTAMSGDAHMGAAGKRNTSRDFGAP